MNFNDLPISQEIKRAVNDMGFTEATEIQEKSIPVILEGVDVIGRSNTGTGKTAAFGIPAIEMVSKEMNGTEVLILCPTRELAMQACDEIIKFSKYMPWVRPAAVYGGANMERQIMQLKRGANIVVGTPGRIMDHIERRTLRLNNIRTIILDEADEMLNMGFREDIETILKGVPETRQTVLFSATMPPAILAITKQFQNDPVMIKVINKQRTVETIEQYYYEIPAGRKNDALELLLLAYEPQRSMIFCNTKRMVDELCETLNAKGFRTAGLHGDMKQIQRTQVMNRFKSGHISVLIATDVAARGIDVDDIDAVFNYDLPQDNEYYIHRIGRTGRAGKSGAAYTLISGRRQVYELKDIARFIKADIIKKELPASDEIRELKLLKISEKVKKAVETGYNTEAEKLLDRLVSEEISEKDIACALINRLIVREIKNIPEFKRVIPAFSENIKRGKTVKVDISVGRKNRIAPNFILGALVDATGMPGKSFGKIDIFDNHTTVEVPEHEHEHVISSMNNGKINGSKVTVRLYEAKTGGKNSRDESYKGYNNYNKRKKPYPDRRKDKTDRN